MNPFEDGTVQAVYVIHARKIPERAKHMKSELGRHGIPFEFIESFDADELTEEIKQRYFTPETNIPTAHISCSIKHFEALRRIAEKNLRCALVLEDDVVLAANFNEMLARILTEAKKLTPPYTVQIGCANNMYVPAKSVRPGKILYPANEVRATDSYLIDAQAARLRLDWFEKNRADRSIDHLFNVIDREKKIPIFWSHPTLVEQGSMTGLFASTIDQNKMEKAIWRIKLRFWWQRLRKKYIYRVFR